MSDKTTRSRGTPSKIFSARRPPTRGQLLSEAQSQMFDEGMDPNSMSSRDWEIARNEKAKANRAALGELAFYQDRGVYEPSPRQRAAWAREDEEMTTEARGQADKELERVGVSPSANDFWDDSGQRRVGTADGGQVVQRAGKYGFGSTVRDKETVDRIASQEAESGDRARRFQQALVDNRARANQRSAAELTPKLAELGAATSPVRPDGSFDTDRAQGMVARATFQQWDDDKRLDKQADRIAKETRRELRGLRNYQENMGPRLNPQSSEELTKRITELETDLSEAADKPGGLNEPSYWRMKAESQYTNQSRQARAAKNLEDAANARSMTYKDLAAALGTSVDNILKYLDDGVITPEELAAARGSN